ncbi:EAL domain-containing protein [Actinotalea sp. M2MS4P-6]|uniref:bifunctional diguanylate cyclase/phosphodiesterase n=1 Tax=Actinotalea sp. M2MS4P-6 TaxID=2983762 RepID=UPI0021E484AB|nr:EAL domain-containing protein [Actinotalea sp. M2MS4P-6]MCV2395726.1 EAL domain-containing protein [Actinotalea sp. M2MS4P-6]
MSAAPSVGLPSTRPGAAWREHAVMTAVVCVAVVVGRATRLHGGELAVIWPAAGVGALWVARSWTRRRQCAAAVGLLTVVAGVLNAITGAGPVVGAALGVVNGLQAAAWCWLLVAVQRRLGRRPLVLRGAADLLVATGAALVAATVAGLGAALVLHATSGAVVLDVLGHWVLRNATGIVVVAAPAIVLLDDERPRVGPADRRPLGEVLVVLLAGAALTAALFGVLDSPAAAFLVLPVAIAVAERYGANVAGVHAVVAGAVVVYATLHGFGPLAVPNPHEAAFLAQALVGVLSLVALSLGLRRDRSLAAEGLLAASEVRFRHAFGTAPIGMVIVEVSSAGAPGPILEANVTATEFAGRSLDELRAMGLEALVHPEDRGTVRRWLARVSRVGEAGSTVEVRFQGADDRMIWGVLSGRRVANEASGSARPSLLCLIEDVTARHRAEAALLRQTLHDPLTGLPNRTLLHDRIAEATATGASAGLLFCDLDGFKEINDTFGHAAGDRALREVAHRLASRMRPIDTVARLGGDEFAVVCPGISTISELERVATRLIDVLDRPLGVESGEGFRVGMSVGVVVVGPGTEAEAALACADAAMYEAKRSGRNAIRPYGEMFGGAVPTLLPALRTALREEQFRLHAQPIVDLDTGATLAVEMLLRWEHPTRGLLGPGEFLPALETSTLMEPVGRWVLAEACRVGGSWARSLGDRTPSIHVNVAAAQLEHPHFVEHVVDAITAGGLPADRLVLEITETRMPNLDSVLSLGLDELRRRGVRIAMDDLGTGYAGLKQLSELPLDIVKLDREFVSHGGRDPRRDAVMRAVLGLSEALGVEPVAEGVETAAQAEMLRRAGYRTAQGFWFGRPEPVGPVPPANRRLDSVSARA